MESLRNLRVPNCIRSEFERGSLFVLATIFSLLAYGINVDNFLIYNVFYSDIILDSEKFLGTPLQMVAESKTIRLFNESLSPVLLNPILNLTSAILLGAVTLYVGFCALKTQTSKEVALVTTILIGVIVHGYFSGLDSSALVFDRKAVVMFSLISTILCLTRGYLIGFVVVALIGIMIHPLDMVSGLAFVLPGYFWFRLNRDKKGLWRVILALSLLVPVMLWMGSAESSNAVPSELSIAQWYRFSLLIEVGDVALFDYLRHSAGLNGALLLLATTCALQNLRNAQLLDYLCLSFIPLTFLFLILEWLHLSGITVGVISETFIASQLRRGFWLVSVLALVRVVVYFFDKYQRGNGLSRARCGLVISAVLVHSIIGFILMVFTVLILGWRELGKFGRIGLMMGIVLLATQLSQRWDQLIVTNELNKLIVFLILLGVTYWIGRSSFKRATYSAILIYCGLVAANNNIRHNIFSDSWDRIAIAPSAMEKQAVEIVKKGASEELQAQLDALIQLNKVEQDPRKGILFASTELGYAAPILAKQRFVFSRWDNTVMFRKKVLDDYLQRLNDFGVDWKVCEKRPEDGMACFLTMTQDRIEKLSEDELDQLADKYSFEYVIRNTPLNRELVYRNDRIKIFRLGTTQDQLVN